LVSSVRTPGKDEKKEEIHPPDVERVNMVTRGRLLNVVRDTHFQMDHISPPIKQTDRTSSSSRKIPQLP
jgi:hypothetical protein